MKKIKSLLALLLAFVMVFSLTACGSPTQQAEKTVSDTFSLIQSCDDAVIKQLLSLEEVSVDMEEDQAIELFKNIYSGLQYEILSSEQVDDNTVIVKTKIVAKDMKTVMENFFQKTIAYALQVAFEDPQPTEEESTEKIMGFLEECMNDETIGTVETECEITVAKDEEGEWDFDMSDELLDALSGNLITATEEISASFQNMIG